MQVQSPCLVPYIQQCCHLWAKALICLHDEICKHYVRTFPILRLLSAYSTWEDETRAKNVLIFVVLWSLFCSVLIMESFCFGKSKMHLQNFYKADCDLAQKWTICAELLTPFGRFSFLLFLFFLSSPLFRPGTVVNTSCKS